jgi:hypothetical protein
VDDAIISENQAAEAVWRALVREGLPVRGNWFGSESIQQRVVKPARIELRPMDLDTAKRAEAVVDETLGDYGFTVGTSWSTECDYFDFGTDGQPLRDTDFEIRIS